MGERRMGEERHDGAGEGQAGIAGESRFIFSFFSSNLTGTRGETGEAPDGLPHDGKPGLARATRS